MADYSALFEAAGKQYNVDPKLLASVMQTESAGVPTAASGAGAVGLMQLGKDTAKDMGVTDRTDPQQSIFGGAKYLAQQLDKYGDVPTALAAYNAGPGAVDKHGGIPPFPETQAYVQKVIGNYTGNAAAGTPGLPPAGPATIPGLPPGGDAPPAGSADPFSALMAKAGPAPSTPNAAPAAPAQAAAPAAPAADPFSALMAKAAQEPSAPATKTAAAATPATPAPAKPSAPLKTSDYLGAAVEPVLTGITSAIAQPIGGAVRLASAALGNTYQGAQAAGNKLSDLLTYHPQTQGGQQALAGIENTAKGAAGAVMASPLGDSLRQMGDSYNKTFVQGAPNALMATINSQVPTVIANAAAGPVVGKVGELAGAATNKLADIAASRAAPTGNALADAARVEPTLAPQAPAAPQPKPNYVPNGDGTFTQTAPKQPAPTAAAQPTAVPSGATPAAAPAATPVAPVFDVPELPKPKTSLAEPEQQANIDAMKAIGLDAQRPSAIAGDKFMAGTEYQQSKLDTPQGEVMRAQLGKEQNAIKDFGQGLVQSTGAAAAAPEAVGQAIRAPLQALSQHYDDAIGGLYKAADAQAAGLPNVTPTTFGNLLKTDSVFEGKSENSQLRKGITAYAKEQGIIGKDGTVQPVTVSQAEGLRKYLNGEWTPQSSGLIGRVKEALDTDVTKAAGTDAYAQARALHAERKNTLDNPNGIASLLNEQGPNGINQAVPDERVSTKMLAMPTNQFAHVVDTLNSLPDHLAPQGQQAIAEVKGALAKKIYQAGDSGGTQNGPSVWNAANVTKALNANASKMALVFTPEEIAQFQTLNRAGHILQTPSAYPGAAVQGHNLVQKGLIYAPAAIGAAVGNHIGGLPGATAGSWAGNALSKKLATAADQRAANALQGMLNSPKVTRAK
jgi:hypothetical protein